MDKKIILVTGATDGIGKEAATTMAAQGHKVIVHGRNEKKTKVVVEGILAQHRDADVDYVLADLLSMKSVKTMADELAARYDHIDVLVNNAGAVFSNEWVLTEDGLERTMQLNVVSPFLLSHLLLPLLRRSRSARIVFEASSAHNASRKPDFDDMTSEKSYNAQGNYNLSKLYIIWVMQRFARYLKEQGITNVTANATHPGMAATQFGQNVKKGFWVDAIYKVSLKLGLMSSIADGARSEIFMAVSPDVEGLSGKYYSNKCREEQPSQKHYSEENEQRIWDYCMKVTEDYR